MNIKRRDCLKTKTTAVIKGEKWVLEILTQKAFEKKHGMESRAMTVLDKRLIEFNAELSLGVLAHELLHAEVKYFHLESTTALTPADFEEILCCFMQYNLIKYHDSVIHLCVEFVGEERTKIMREELCK